MTDNLSDKISATAPQAANICAELNQQILKLGFPPERADVTLGSHVQYSLQRDTFSGLDSLVGGVDAPDQRLQNGFVAVPCGWDVLCRIRRVAAAPDQK